MTRRSRSFSDLDATFAMTPRTRDVAARTDDNAIRGALRNLIHTRHYERPFAPELGCQIHNLLFEPADMLSRTVAERAIRDAITKFEPRVELINVEVYTTDENEMFVQVEYKIRNTNQPGVFSTTFSRVR